MGMGVIPEQAWRMISWNFNCIAQSLAWHGDHSEHVILRRERRDAESMKMQVRHIHAGTQSTSFAGIRGKIVDVGDLENVTRESTDQRSYRLTIESKGIAAVFMHYMERKGYNMILRFHPRRLWQ